MKLSPTGGLGAAAPLVFLLLFFYLPLGLVLGEVVRGGGSLILEVLSQPYYQKILRFTLFQAGVSTIFALMLGLPGGYLLGRFRFPGRNVVKSLSTLPFVLPSILVVLGFVLFFGNNGALNRFLAATFRTSEPPLKILYSFKAIILAHGFYNFPIIMRLTSPAWMNLPANQINAARSLGAPPFRLFRTVTLPHLIPALLASASLVFLFCFMSFAIILVLGGGPQFSTLEVEVYRLAKFTLDLPAAAVLGLTGTVITLAFLYLNITLEKRGSALLNRTGAALPLRDLILRERGRKLRPRGVVLGAYLLVTGIILLGPLLAVVINSLQIKTGWGAGPEWSLKWYVQLFQNRSGTPGAAGAPGGPVSLEALKNSLTFALGAVALGVPLGTILALWTHRKEGPSRLRRPVELLFMLPLGVSPVILGLGYLKLLPRLPESFRHGGLLITGAHAVIAYPFVIRSVSASLHRVSPGLRRAAASLGASPGRILFTVDLPLIKAGIFSGAAFVFALSLGEINATILLARSGQTTLPLAIYRLIGAYNFHGACALGTVLLLLCGAAFIIIDKFEEALP